MRMYGMPRIHNAEIFEFTGRRGKISRKRTKNGFKKKSRFEAKRFIKLEENPMSKYAEVLLKECVYIKTQVAYSFMLELTEAYDKDIAELKAQLPKMIVPKKEIHNTFCDCGCLVTYSNRYCCQCGCKLNWDDVK